MAIVVNLAWVVWTLVVIGGGTVPQPTQIFGVIAVSLRGGAHGHRLRRLGVRCVELSGSPPSIGQIFIALYPNVMVSSTNAAYNLTVNNSSAGHYALVVMTIVAVVFLPLVLLYQGWSFHVFRRRVTAAPASPRRADPSH